MSSVGRPIRHRPQGLGARASERLTTDQSGAGLALVAAVIAAAFFALARYPIVYDAVRAPLDIVPGPIAQALSILAPLPAALTAALCVLEPWAGLVAVLLLTPWFDAAQVGWWAGPVQVLGLTVFVLALATGLALAARDPRRGARLRARLASHRLAFGGGLVLLALATASTVRSPDIGASGPVWLHGVVEPLAFGLLVLLLVPDRRGLGRALLALGLSAALAGLINLAQTIPSVPSLLALQDNDRLIFARLTYFNVGLFGEVLAMAVPLLGAAALARFAPPASADDPPRRSFDPVGLLIVAALVLALGCLYLTFSKSAWLATALALVALGLAWLRSRRARSALLVGALVVSMVIAPWPLVALRPLAPALADGYEAVMTNVWGADRLASWDPGTAAGKGSIVQRLYATEAGLRMARDHPLLGVGLDRFQAELRAGYRDPRTRVTLDAAHDLLPNLAAELGIPFALLVAAAMAAALVSAWRVWRRAGDVHPRVLAAGLGSALIGWWVVSATFDPDLYRVWRLMASDIVFAAVLVALALALPGLVDEASGRQRGSDGGPAGSG